MSLRVNNNISAINSQRAINRNAHIITRQLERMASGLRVNRAADDASGLAISEGMRGELAGLNQNLRNAEQAANLLQVAEGSLQEVNNVLIRMRELAVQSSSSTVNDSNREALAAEFTQLLSEIDRIAQATTYNHETLLTGFGNAVSTASTALTASPTTGVQRVDITAAEEGTYVFVDNPGDSTLTLGNGVVTQTLNLGTLLDGSAVATGATVVANFDRLGIQVVLAGANAQGAVGDYEDGDLEGYTLAIENTVGGIFQVGPRASYVNRIEVGIDNLGASGDRLNLASLSIDTLANARQALSGLDRAVNAVSSERGKLGAVQNRLAFAIAYSENEIESIQASEASIRDADIAKEVTEFSRARLLLQSGNAMLIHSNVNAVRALALL